MGRKQCGKRRNFLLLAISPFPAVFSKDLYCRHVKTRACLGKNTGLSINTFENGIKHNTMKFKVSADYKLRVAQLTKIALYRSEDNVVK